MKEFRQLTVDDAAEYHEVLIAGYAENKNYPISFDAINFSQEESRAWILKYPVYGQSGTGIGLYLIKQIVGMLGGEIGAKNNRRSGASFRVVLPLLRSNQGLMSSESELVGSVDCSGISDAEGAVVPFLQEVKPSTNTATSIHNMIATDQKK